MAYSELNLAVNKFDAYNVMGVFHPLFDKLYQNDKFLEAYYYPDQIEIVYDFIQERSSHRVSFSTFSKFSHENKETIKKQFDLVHLTIYKTTSHTNPQRSKRKTGRNFIE